MWEVNRPVSSNNLSLFSFWDSHNVYTVKLDGVLQLTQALPLLLHSFCFLYLRLSNYNCLSFTIVDSLFCLLKSPAEALCFFICLFLISAIITFSSSISTWFLVIVPISVLIFPTWFYTILLITFSCLFMVSFYSFRVIKTVNVETYLLSVWASSWMTSISFFLLYQWVRLSCFFVCFVIFLLKTGQSNNGFTFQKYKEIPQFNNKQPNFAKWQKNLE